MKKESPLSKWGSIRFTIWDPVKEINEDLDDGRHMRRLAQEAFAAHPNRR